MRNALVFLALGFVACTDGNGTDTDDDSDTTAINETPQETTDRQFSEMITLDTSAIVGDGQCWATGDAWLTQTVDIALQVDEDRVALVADFQSDDAVPGATLSIYDNDDLSGVADTIIVTDTGGEAEITAPSCSPIGVKVIKEGTKDTYESHQIFEPIAVNDDGTVNSVSVATFTLIPALLGVSVDSDKSVVAGTVYDCNGDPIEGAQVVLRDADGNIPFSLVMNYFVEDFPDRDQIGTSPDGLWIAINVPDGVWTAEAYISDGAGGHEMVGTTELTAFPNTIGISNIYWGYDGGIRYPDSCLVVAQEG